MPLQLKLATPDITSVQLAEIRSQAATKVSELQKLRQLREVTEAERGVASARVRAAEAALRDAHQQRLQQRQWVLEQQAMQVTRRHAWFASCFSKQPHTPCTV